MLYEIAREFLLDNNLKSKFVINKIKIYIRIARVYLIYLIKEKIKSL